IHVAVVVIISGRAAGVPSRIAQVRLGRHIRKSPVAIVMKQVIVRRVSLPFEHARRPVDKKDVLVPVIVVIDEADAQGFYFNQVLGDCIAQPDLDRQPGRLGDVGEGGEFLFRKGGGELRSARERGYQRNQNENDDKLQQSSNHAIFRRRTKRLALQDNRQASPPQ